MTIKQYRSMIARKGGLATKGLSTPAKRRAARENGRKGGRPRKKAVTSDECQVTSFQFHQIEKLGGG